MHPPELGLQRDQPIRRSYSSFEIHPTIATHSPSPSFPFNPFWK